MNILVTGGASGLGEAMTRKLASNTSNQVYFTYCKSKEKAILIEKELRNARAVRCDFNHATELNELLQKMSEWDLQVVINNAMQGM